VVRNQLRFQRIPSSKKGGIKNKIAKEGWGEKGSTASSRPRYSRLYWGGVVFLKGKEAGEIKPEARESLPKTLAFVGGSRCSKVVEEGEKEGWCNDGIPRNERMEGVFGQLNAKLDVKPVWWKRVGGLTGGRRGEGKDLRGRKINLTALGGEKVVFGVSRGGRGREWWTGSGQKRVWLTEQVLWRKMRKQKNWEGGE